MHTFKSYQTKNRICMITMAILMAAFMFEGIYSAGYDRDHMDIHMIVIYGITIAGAVVFYWGLKFAGLSEDARQTELQKKQEKLEEEQAIQTLGSLVVQYNQSWPFPMDNVGDWLRCAGKHKESTRPSDYPAAQYLVDLTLARLQNEMHNRKTELERYDEELQAKKVNQQRALTSREINSLIEKRAEIQTRTDQAKNNFFSSCTTAAKLGFNVWEKDNTLYLLLKLK